MKRSKVIIVAAALLLSLATAVGAAKLSPALDILSFENKMTVSAPVGFDVTFGEDDFADVLGALPYQIKLTSLPPTEDGTLFLGTSPAFEGQAVSRVNFSQLRFKASAECVKSSFEFTSDGTYTVECEILLTDKENSPPVCRLPVGAAVTMTDIATYGTLFADDADGDETLFEVTKYPSNGLLSLSSDGNYSYTPYASYTGSDSFSFRARDTFGNYSDECTLDITIRERKSDSVLCDMEGHRSHVAALSAVDDGSIEAISENGTLYFDPDDTMTREAWLTSLMKALGAGELSSCATVFVDDDEISAECGGYVDAAWHLGIIRGTSENGKLYFKPAEVITRAEAAVMLNRVLGAKGDDALAVFSDTASIPAWAVEDVSALSAIGILNGNGGLMLPHEELTRAQAAEILYRAKNLYM